MRDGAGTEYPAEPSDREVLAAIATGDRAAMALLYDRYAGQALGLSYRVVGDRTTAEDVVQDAFLAVWSRAGTYRPELAEPRSWLLSIVRHRAIDNVRRRSPEQHADLDQAPAPTGAVDGVWSTIVRRLERAEVAAALSRLSLEQRESIELAFFRGLTHTEIATRTGLPLGTVKGRVRLGLQRLRQYLEATQQPLEYPDHRSWSLGLAAGPALAGAI